jgi:DNA polymerase-3 subunit alpha
MNSCLTIDDIINFAIENNQKYVALVDVNTMFGTIDFYNKALKKKLKPIIGLQINYQNNKLVIIPKNKIGLSDTYKISSLINSNKFFDLSKYIGQCYLINLDNNEIDLLKSSCLKYFTISKINPIAVKENFYANGGDKVILKALSAIKEGKKLSDYENNNNFDNSNMLSDDQAKNIFSSESINNL